jgi:hypothetical protein
MKDPCVEQHHREALLRGTVNSVLKIALLVAWCCVWFFLAGGFAGCGGQHKPTLQQAIDATTVAVDATYGLTVELCDQRERAIVTRPPTTLEKDKEDLAKVREICDRIFQVFNQTRKVRLLIGELEQIQ